MNELKENKKYLLTAGILSIYIVLAELFDFISYEHTLMAIFSIFLLFLLSLVSKTAFSIVGIFVLVVNSAIFHILFHWGKEIVLFERIQVALLSPPTEIKEYLQNNISSIDIVEFIYLFLGLFGFFYLLKQKNRLKILRFGAIVLLGLILFGLYQKSVLNKMIPFRYVEHYVMANSWKDQMIQRKEYIKQNFHKKVLKSYLYDKVVVIVGESANKHHMSLYGYRYKTTKFLDSLSHTKSTIKLNVIAPANQTRFSVPLCLTDTKVEDFSKYFKTKSIVTKFREVGYKTYWISNQFKVGEYDTYISSMANEANYQKIENLHYVLQQAKVQPDEVLLKEIDKVYKPKQKQLFVVHLMGSHAMYDKRYPKDKALFKDPKNVIQEYDNTIFYTDYVLKQLYKRFKKDRVLFVYFSDHSEIPSTKLGHGFAPSYKNEYEIPLFIYSSVDNKKLAILKQKNKELINNESLASMVEYLAGLSKDLKLSYDTKVISVSPHRIVDYQKLKYYKKP